MRMPTHGDDVGTGRGTWHLRFEHTRLEVTRLEGHTREELQDEEDAAKDPTGKYSVNVKTASLSLFCCRTIELRRDRWLWMLHAACFAIHLTWMVFTIQASSGDMTVELTRLEPNWENQGGEFSYKVVALDADEQIFRIDVVTALFFGISAGMHAIWVFIGPWEWSKPFLWNKLDECLCWW